MERKQDVSTTQLSHSKNIYMCVCMYIYLHIYIYIHTHTHTHIYLRGSDIYLGAAWSLGE